ncbi:adhesin [Streptomyces sp. NPDC093085]|uniref:adhesin n=1 Tax=Streptomyces sp. NPDC093085 TaxID=3155068 RepID=UPI003426D76F
MAGMTGGLDHQGRQARQGQEGRQGRQRPEGQQRQESQQGQQGRSQAYETPEAGDDRWVSRTMMPGAGDDDLPRPSGRKSGASDKPRTPRGSRGARTPRAPRGSRGSRGARGLRARGSGGSAISGGPDVSGTSGISDGSRVAGISGVAGGSAPRPGPFGPASGPSAPAARKRLLGTVAVVALGCLAVTVAVVVNNAGGDDGSDLSGSGRPPRADAPELPGLGGGSDTPSTIPGGGTGEAGGAAPGTSAPPFPRPTPSGSPSPAPSGAADGPGEGEWAGPGCTTGSYREHGRFENGKAAWYTVKTGGYKGSSCDGRFSSVPMSGSPYVDGHSSAVWSWKLDASYEKCALAVYVPDSGRDADVAGDPTVYQVLADPADAASGYATFGVRQTAHRGSLVEVGSHEVKGGTFSVRMVDRGQDWGSEERFGAHHAAAQMRVTCT